VVLDAFSRKVAGWALGERLDAGLGITSDVTVMRIWPLQGALE
jgi:hypothetical protein